MLLRFLLITTLVLLTTHATAESVFAILPATTVDHMLNQCSRGTPGKGEGTWSPTEAEISRVDAALPDALLFAGHEEAAAAFPSRLKQYVGIVRRGRRLVYVNVLDKGMANYSDWRQVPTIVCDGGSTFFGVEIDVDTLMITHFAKNGQA